MLWVWTPELKLRTAKWSDCKLLITLSSPRHFVNSELWDKSTINTSRKRLYHPSITRLWPIFKRRNRYFFFTCIGKKEKLIQRRICPLDAQICGFIWFISVTQNKINIICENAENLFKKLTSISGGYLKHLLYSMLYPGKHATLKQKEHNMLRSVCTIRLQSALGCCLGPR